MKYASVLLVLAPILVSGLKLPIRSSIAPRATKLSKGKAFALKPQVNAVAADDKTLNITNNQDLIYIVDATVAGQTFGMQLDSGSSDLWVDLGGKSAIGTTTNINLNLSYGIGFVAGPVATANVEFAGFNVTNQAFIAGTHVDNPATVYGAEGVLGMGFTSLSHVDAAVNSSGGSWGRSLLYNIFTQNPEEPNYVAYKLQRSGSADDDEGEFTIGELDPDFSGVTNTGKIATFPQVNPSRWTILLDSIIASGQTVPLGTSSVSNAPSSKLVVLPDTGTSLVFAPRAIVDAIYSTVPGSRWSAPDNAYILNCSVEVDVSVVINNRQFDIHPLDMVQVAGSDGNGNPICASSWRPQAFEQAGYDILLGVAFMRSIYSVYDFGDFGPDNKTMGNPYLLFWSIVNGSDASTEFHTIRGGTKNSTFLSNAGVNGAGADSATIDGAGNVVSGPDISALSSKVDKLNTLIPILFALTGLNLLVLLIIAAMFFFRSSKRKRGKVGKNKTKSRLSPPPGAGDGDGEVDGALVPESPGSYIALPRPRAPGLQADYRPLSSGSTLRDSRLYDAPGKVPGSPGSAKFSMESRYDPPRQSVAGIPEERYDPVPIRQSIASMLPLGAGPSTPPGNVPFPRQSIALDNVMAPPVILETPPAAARRSIAETLVMSSPPGKFDEGKGKEIDENDKLANSAGSLSPQPRNPFGLTPPEARYDPAMRHSYAGYGEPKVSFDNPVRRSVISSASESEVVFDPLLRRQVHRTPSNPDLPARDPFLGSSPQQQVFVNPHDVPRREPSPLSQAALAPETEESSKDV